MSQEEKNNPQSHREHHLDWQPSIGLRNPHLQTVLASSGFRKAIVRKRAKVLIDASQEVVLECKDGIKMHGLISRHHDPKPLVMLIHGWEGCVDSLYLLSLAGYLFDQGYDIFRLHLRDHGPTHKLNPDMFHAGRVEEVAEALAQVRLQHADYPCALVGFSLGGNFALRVATIASEYGFKLNQVIGVSPLLHALNTLWALEYGAPIYRQYFRHKWKKSIHKKAMYFPDRVNKEAFCESSSLTVMTEYFVRNHTPFDAVKDYFGFYSITGQKLKDLKFPTSIILSEDDPVIPFRDLFKIKGNSLLDVVRVPYGGHCGFIENYKMEAWIDKYIGELLKPIMK